MSGTTWKDGNFCFVRFMSLFSVVIIVIFLPMNFFADRYLKKNFIAFFAAQLAGRRKICPINFYLLSLIVIVLGSEFVILYIFLLDIICGHFIPTTLRSCSL